MWPTISAVRRCPLRSFRRGVAPVSLVLLTALALRANLAIDTGLRGVFFRSMALPYGAIDGRRPPSETCPALALRASLSRCAQNLAVAEDVAHNIGSQEAPIEILP